MNRIKLDMPQKREIDLYHRDGSTTKMLILDCQVNDNTFFNWLQRCDFCPRHSFRIFEGNVICTALESRSLDCEFKGKFYIRLTIQDFLLEVIAVDKFAVLEFLLKYKPLLE